MMRIFYRDLSIGSWMNKAGWALWSSREYLEKCRISWYLPPKVPIYWSSSAPHRSVRAGVKSVCEKTRKNSDIVSCVAQFVFCFLVIIIMFGLISHLRFYRTALQLTATLLFVVRFYICIFTSVYLEFTCVKPWLRSQRSTHQVV